MARCFWLSEPGTSSRISRPYIFCIAEICTVPSGMFELKVLTSVPHSRLFKESGVRSNFLLSHQQDRTMQCCVPETAVFLLQVACHNVINPECPDSSFLEEPCEARSTDKLTYCIPSSLQSVPPTRNGYLQPQRSMFFRSEIFGRRKSKTLRFWMYLLTIFKSYSSKQGKAVDVCVLRLIPRRKSELSKRRFSLEAFNGKEMERSQKRKEQLHQNIGGSSKFCSSLQTRTKARREKVSNCDFFQWWEQTPFCASNKNDLSTFLNRVTTACNQRVLTEAGSLTASVAQDYRQLSKKRHVSAAKQEHILSNHKTVAIISAVKVQAGSLSDTPAELSKKYFPAWVRRFGFQCSALRPAQKFGGGQDLYHAVPEFF